MSAFLIANIAPLMFVSLIVVLLLGYPVAFSLGRGRHRLCAGRHPARAAHAVAGAGAARAHLGRDVERHAAGRAVFHLHGPDPGTKRHGRGSARHHRPGVRTGARRARLRRHLRRRAARGDHRRRRGIGHFDGPDLAAHHAALRLRPPLRQRRHRRVRHPGADHSAVAGADHHGRPARQVGRRHVRRRVHSRHHAGMPVRGLCVWRLHGEAGLGAGAAAGSAHLARA